MTAQVQRFAGTSALPFSAATKADGLVYASGTIVPEGDIRAQTKAVLESLDATLKKAGSIDPAKLLTATNGQKNFKLPTGSTVFSWTAGYTHRASSVIGFDKSGAAILVDTIKP